VKPNFLDKKYTFFHMVPIIYFWIKSHCKFNVLKQAPVYYAHGYCGQEFEQNIAWMACLCTRVSGISARATQMAGGDTPGASFTPTSGAGARLTWSLGSTNTVNWSTYVDLDFSQHGDWVSQGKGPRMLIPRELGKTCMASFPSYLIVQNRHEPVTMNPPCTTNIC
jgi:hypothetical protein